MVKWLSYIVLFFALSMNYLSAFNSTGTCLAIDNNNKIVVGGFVTPTTTTSTNNFCIARFNADGSLDTTFNPGGGQPGVTSFSFQDTGDIINALAIDNNNNIVVAGAATNGTTTSFALARFLNNGTLDTSFGTASAIPGTFLFSVTNGASTAYGVTIDSNNRIVATGATNATTFNSLIVVRLLENGTPDPSFTGQFSPAGTLQTQSVPGELIYNFTSFDNIAYAITTDQNNNIVLAGTANNQNNNSDILVVRLLTDGSLDQTLNVTGSVTTDIFGSADIAQSIAVDQNNNIVVGGYTFGESIYDFVVLRYTPDGALDTTFNPLGIAPAGITGTPGIVITEIGSNNSLSFGLMLDSNNEIVLTGYSLDSSLTQDITTVRYMTNGSLDTSFGGTGIVITPITPDRATATSQSSNCQGLGVVLDNNNNVVVAGFSNNGLTNTLTVVRYTSTGILDPSFNASSTTPGISAPPITLGLDQGLNYVVGREDFQFIPLPPALFEEYTQAERAAISARNVGFKVPAIESQHLSLTDEHMPVVHGTGQPYAPITLLINNVIVAHGTIDVNGRWSITLPFLPDGTYHLKVSAVDPISHIPVESSPLTFVVDTHVPAPPVIEKPDNGVFTDQSTPLLSGTAEPNAHIKIITDDGKLFETQSSAQGRWSMRIPKLKDGKYSVYALAQSPAGMMSTKSVLREFIVDTRQPVEPVITYPTHDLVVNGSSFTISGTAKPYTPGVLTLANKTVKVNADSQGKWNVALTDYPAGTYTVQATFTDPLHNSILTTPGRTFYVNAVPVVSTKQPVIYDEHARILKGFVQPASTVTISIDKTNVAQRTANTQGYWSYKLPAPASAPQELLVKVLFTDAGNKSVRSIEKMLAL